jgi:signal transduction histidine kinase
MTLAFVATVTLLTSLACGGLVAYARHTADRQAVSALDAAANGLRREVASNEGAGDLNEMMEDVPALRDEKIAVAMIDTNGRIIRHTPGSSPPQAPDAQTGWRTQRVRAGDVTIVVGLPWKRTEESLAALAISLTLLGACVVAAGGACAWALVGRTISPIAALSRQAQTAGADTLQVRLTAPSNDAEISDLVVTLNGLLGRLCDTAAAQGRFYAAASHELRTPLQALSGHLEVAMSRPDRTREEYRQTLAEALTQTARLTALVKELLLLNQIETAQRPPPSECVALDDLLLSVCRPLETAIAGRRLVIADDVDAAGECRVPPLHLEILLRNLVENAVKYATAGSTISVHARQNSSRCRIEITNATEPLDPAVQARLGEAFYRPDASRMAATGGNGLGLAICRAVCAANGWSLEIEPDGALFRVTAVL